MGLTKPSQADDVVDKLLVAWLNLLTDWCCWLSVLTTTTTWLPLVTTTTTYLDKGQVPDDDDDDDDVGALFLTMKPTTLTGDDKVWSTWQSLACLTGLALGQGKVIRCCTTSMGLKRAWSGRLLSDVWPGRLTWSASSLAWPGPQPVGKAWASLTWPDDVPDDDDDGGLTWPDPGDDPTTTTTPGVWPEPGLAGGKPGWLTTLGA